MSSALFTFVLGFGGIIGLSMMAARRVGVFALILPFVVMLPTILALEFGLFDRKRSESMTKKEEPENEDEAAKALKEKVGDALLKSLARLGFHYYPVGMLVVRGELPAGTRFLNAAVSTFFGTVYASPDLVELASEEELDAAVGHEVGHTEGIACDTLDICRIFRRAFVVGILFVIMQRSLTGILIHLHSLGLSPFSIGHPPGLFEQFTPYGVLALHVVIVGAMDWLNEFEADYLSARYTRNPQGMVNLLKLLVRYSPPDNSPVVSLNDITTRLSVLQTHPPDALRRWVLRKFFSLTD